MKGSPQAPKRTLPSSDLDSHRALRFRKGLDGSCRPLMETQIGKGKTSKDSSTRPEDQRLPQLRPICCLLPVGNSGDFAAPASWPAMLSMVRGQGRCADRAANLRARKQGSRLVHTLHYIPAYVDTNSTGLVISSTSASLPSLSQPVGPHHAPQTTKLSRHHGGNRQCGTFGAWYRAARVQ
ncbi:21d22e24-e412-4cdc-8a02-5bae0eeaf9fd [Thermothielavioides terrestris]|uniref:21d22e24-e412-4cdc-8a02-5bae0eeaf9fd n=1 Tax=Thermothielavioides terrestris TaxID=2587410 RepID=A0A3S4BJG7_9PEZI|nr:21d22e24-e412-4cdc-8a02-5bae0eeaf9fd [Thermothielavioides terrestris]